MTITGTANFAGTVAPNIITLVSASGSILIADATLAFTNSATAIDAPGVDFSLNLMGNQLFLTWSRRHRRAFSVC